LLVKNAVLLGKDNEKEMKYQIYFGLLSAFLYLCALL